MKIDWSGWTAHEKHKNIKRALDTIENEKIWILKIQEENTKGMKGPCEPGPHNNFYKYLLTEGSSGKEEGFDEVLMEWEKRHQLFIHI